jgi:hypothetical protein
MSAKSWRTVLTATSRLIGGSEPITMMTAESGTLARENVEISCPAFLRRFEEPDVTDDHIESAQKDTDG